MSANINPSSLHKSSTFSHTCNLLSQYLKEKRSSSNNIVNIPGCYSAIPTMNLFPHEAAAGSLIFNASSSAPNCAPAAAAQMTIFYRGQVRVIDDMSPDKATQVMQLAAAAQYHPVRTNMMIQASDLPIARKASLERFLIKKIRKDRIKARAAPYSLSYKTTASGMMGVSGDHEQDRKAWLSLATGSQLSSGCN